MNSRRQYRSASNPSDDEDSQITSNKSSRRQYGRNKYNSDDDSIVGINANENQALLDEYNVEPASTGGGACRNLPARFAIAIWAFFGFFCLYSMRVNLSVAIVAMVAPQSASNKSVQACPVEKTNSSKPPEHYEFDWDPPKQELVLGAFFYGYVVTQVIVGNFAEKVGGKWVFGGCILLSGILTLLTPLAARIDYRLLVAIRILIGMASGPTFPSAGVIWGKWIPASERSTIPPAAQSGTSIGIICTTPLVSIMAESGFLGGWPSAFYVFGTLACVWFIGWAFFGFSTPDQHPRISQEEKLFLSKNIVARPKRRATPWLKIATSPPVYGIAIMHICYNFIYYTLLTSLPTYFATILNFNLHQNGFIFALPYTCLFLVTLGVGRLVDYIRGRKILSITVLRKLQAVIGMVGTSIFLIAIGYMGCSHVPAVICCILAVGFLGFEQSGPVISHLDVASNYAGTLVGITNSLAAIPGFVGPIMVGALTNNNQTVAAWRLIFEISAGIGMFGTIVYCILFNGEEQPWNRVDENDDDGDEAIDS